MPDLSLQGLAAFSAIPSQLAANFYAPQMNQSQLAAMQLANQGTSLSNTALQQINMVRPGLLQNQLQQGQLSNQAAQQTVPYAGQQAAANVALAQGQGALQNAQAQFYPQIVNSKLMQAGAMPLKYASPQFKAGYDNARLNGQNSFGGLPIFRWDQSGSALGGQGTPQDASGLSQAAAQNMNYGSTDQSTLGLMAPQQTQGYQLGQSSSGLPIGNAGAGLPAPNQALAQSQPPSTIEQQTANALNQKLTNPAPAQITQRYMRAANLMQTTNMLGDYLQSIPDLNKYTGATGEAYYKYQDALPKNSPRDPGYYQAKVIKDTILPALSKQLQSYAVGSTNGNLLMQTEDDLNPFGATSNINTIQNSLSALKDVVNRESQTAALAAGKMPEYNNMVKGLMPNGQVAPLPEPTFNNAQDATTYSKSLTPWARARFIAQRKKLLSDPNEILGAMAPSEQTNSGDQQ